MLAILQSALARDEKDDLTTVVQVRRVETQREDSGLSLYPLSQHRSVARFATSVKHPNVALEMRDDLTDRSARRAWHKT